MRVIKSIGQRENEIGSRGSVLRVTSINCVSGKSRFIAKIFKVAPTIGASPIHAAQPRNTDAQTSRQSIRHAFHNFPDDLMARNHLFTLRCQFTLNDVKVRAAHSASSNTQQNLPRVQIGPRHF